MNEQEILQERRSITVFLERRLDQLVAEICSATEGQPNIGNLAPVLGADLLAEARDALDISDTNMLMRHGVYPAHVVVNPSRDIMPTLEELRHYAGIDVGIMYPEDFADIDISEASRPITWDKQQVWLKETDKFLKERFQQIMGPQISAQNLGTYLTSNYTVFNLRTANQGQRSIGQESTKSDNTFARSTIMILYNKSILPLQAVKSFIDPEYESVRTKDFLPLIEKVRGTTKEWSAVIAFHDIAHGLQTRFDKFRLPVRMGRCCDELSLRHEAQADIIAIHNFLERGGDREAVKDFLAIRAVTAVLAIGTLEPGFNTALFIDRALRGQDVCTPRMARQTLTSVRRILKLRSQNASTLPSLIQTPEEAVAAVNRARQVLDRRATITPDVRRLIELFIEGIGRISPSISLRADALASAHITKRRFAIIQPHRTRLIPDAPIVSLAA